MKIHIISTEPGFQLELRCGIRYYYLVRRFEAPAEPIEIILSKEEALKLFKTISEEILK